MTGKQWAAIFEASCREWQVKLGLMDWALYFRVDTSEVPPAEADVGYSCENRYATLTSYTNAPNPDPPARTALHEMLHLLLADALFIAAARSSDTHADTVREEHKVIMRLATVLEGPL